SRVSYHQSRQQRRLRPVRPGAGAWGSVRLGAIVTNIETSLRASRSSWQILTACGLDTPAELLNPSSLARALTEPFRQQLRREVRDGRYLLDFALSGETALDRLDDVGEEIILLVSDIKCRA